jgi:hypothetical protein
VWGNTVSDAAAADAGPCGKLVSPSPGYAGCQGPSCVEVDPSQLSLLDAGDAEVDANGVPPQTPCDLLCGYYVMSCKPVVHDGGAWVICQSSCTGRRPHGFVPHRAASGDDPGAYFSHMAELEAASIGAFRTLARELGAHGAPNALRRAARRAARDEIAHTRSTRALAAARGARYETPRVLPTPQRTLEAIAIENAVEGCVRETFGALVALYQARHARSPGVRRVFRRIAREELRHAALSWRVAAWVEPRLGADARNRLREARDRAVRALTADLADPPPLVRAEAGLPSARELRGMALALGQSLWS